ncbi:hypothetical protein QZH56_36810 [Streptomyces olivoreticuli]|uniref:hypothetical protein n=1 Tax=Streptomyces olivoreticuli TaxID=68246 RepID=UPI002658CD34|nr:hypothetical protein [Streptomyces olivoreticuli]WKK24140.1 hypothetical protein QZH56_36810 [Streptomyces olivoreticuli]
MRLLTGADILAFHETRYDLLVLDGGEFTHLDRSDIEDGQRVDSYLTVTTTGGGEVQVLLERSAVVAGDWFPDALDADGTLSPVVADEMASVINCDADLRTIFAVREIRALTAAWEEASAEADRLAALRACRIADFAAACGSQSAAARSLGMDHSTVNKLVKKAARQ